MPSWFNLQAYTFDKPIQYKKLLVYPARMEEYFEFNIYVSCFLLEKNTTVEGISKTYLEYLYLLASKKDEELNLSKFDFLLKLCLRKDDLETRYWFRDEDKKAVFSVDGETYDSNDFDELRLLICEQNSVELPDETIQKEIRDSMEETKRLRAKMSGNIPPTLEDMIVCVMVSTSLSLEDIAKLSIRKFGQILQRADSKLHYQVYLTSAMSGFVEFKDKKILKHWMSGIESDKWGDTMINVETIKGKLTFDDKKKK
jgi:hypothetical protein